MEKKKDVSCMMRTLENMKRGAIFKAPSKDCNRAYIGETKSTPIVSNSKYLLTT